jgi:transposase
MLADDVDYVIGVDTHRDEHAVAVVDRVGSVVAETTSMTQDAAFERLVIWADKVAPGSRAWAIEGSGSYGAGLTRFLTELGEHVLEVHRLTRDRRSHAKTDPIDAVRAARTALSRDLQATPRNGEGREALRILIATRRSAVDSRRVALQQLRAFNVTAPDPLRRELSQLTQARLLARCARLRLHASSNRASRALTLALRTCAQRALQAHDEAEMLDKEITALVDELAPGLRDEPGVGPISAAQVLITWSHPGRIRSEAAFARMAGAAPIPATSGQTVRHRLDRAGDRQLNRALHTVVLSRRQRQHPATIAYIERRIAEGKSSREATRCLKRYIARHLYRRLNAITNTP